MSDDDEEFIEWAREAFANVPPENMIYLPEEAYQKLLDELDRPPTISPRLTELLKRGNPRQEDGDGN